MTSRLITGTEGDTYERYLVRIAEMRESVTIAQQALDNLPDGPFATSDRKIWPPPKEEITYSMESLIHHFKLWTEGFKPPKGDAYVAVESGRGELGCYIVATAPTSRGACISARRRLSTSRRCRTWRTES